MNKKRKYVKINEYFGKSIKYFEDERSKDMKLFKPLALLVLVGLLCPVITVNAAEYGFGFGPRIGLMKAEDSEDINTVIGGFVRLNLLPAFTIEGAVDYRKIDLEGGIEMKQTPIYASVLFNLLSEKETHPYLIAGLGLYNVKLEGNVSDFEIDQSEQSIGYHLGVGLDAPLGEKINIAIDFKYTFLDIEVDELDAGNNEIDAKAWLLNVGLIFHK